MCRFLSLAGLDYEFTTTPAFFEGPGTLAVHRTLNFHRFVRAYSTAVCVIVGTGLLIL